jgi:pimeloyl-ACP methyl ester carboxylesterase
MESLYRYYEWRDDADETGTLEKAERIQRDHAVNFPGMLDGEMRKIHDVLRTYPLEPVDHSEVTVPSLLMYGERESEVAAPHAEYMADAIPVAEVRRIPNAGHNSHVDNLEFVVETLREFLFIVTDHTNESD